MWALAATMPSQISRYLNSSVPGVNLDDRDLRLDSTLCQGNDVCFLNLERPALLMMISDSIDDDDRTCDLRDYVILTVKVCLTDDRLAQPAQKSPPYYYCLLMIDEVKSTDIDCISETSRRNRNSKCHRHLHIHMPGLRRFCSCGKCSLTAVFEHTCPRAYGALIPHLHSTTLMSYYSSDFLLPADNWWRVPNLMMLLILGGRDLSPPLAPQHASIAICDRKWLIRSLARKCAKDGHADKDISNTELHFHSLQQQILTTKCSYESAYELNDTTTNSDPHSLANLALLLLLISGDVEVNPGPRSGMFIK